jgi:hypothetical protein
MPLHDRNHIRARADESVFASVELKTALPKYRFPGH